MATTGFPARSPRRLYKIEEIQRTVTNDGQEVQEPIVVKMKISHATFLGLTEIPIDDPIFYGENTPQGGTTYTYFRNIGGFKEASYRLEAKTKFTLTEKVPDVDGGYTDVQNDFRSISIGFPRGHTVNEVMVWLRSLAVANQIEAVITPAGRRIPLGIQ